MYPSQYDSTNQSQANLLARAPTTKGSSTTSEFTKRKNWSQRIVEEMQDVLHVLSPTGVFLFASPSSLDTTGFTPEELVGRGITDFIERDDIDNFIRDFTASIQLDAPLTTYIRFRRKDEAAVLFEITGQPYYSTSAPIPASASSSRTVKAAAAAVNNATPSASASGSAPDGKGGEKICKCFFAMARLYPSKNNAMLDSFLELKIENEKLRQRLAEVYREIEGEPDDGAGNVMGMNVDGSSSIGGQSGESRPISGYPQRMNSISYHPGGGGYGISEDGTSNSTNNSTSNMYYAYSSSAPAGSLSSTNNPYNSQQQQQGGSSQYADPSHISGGGGGGGMQNGSGTGGFPQDNVLVSSAGLIPSTSNTYGALGIGISANNASRSGNSSQQHHPGGGGSNGLHAGQGGRSSADNGSGIGNGLGGAGGLAGLGNSGQGPLSASQMDTDMLDPDGKKKLKKKQRVDEGEFVCRDCGTVDSPEWRRGPLGPKTLCNACGLRWAKKNKQSRTSMSGALDAPIVQ